MKIRDVRNQKNEGLPPHLAKFVDKDGDWTADAKKRLGKDGVDRLSKTRKKTKDVTPKGYGPVEEDVNSFVKVDKRTFYGLEQRGATFNPYTGGLYMDDRLIGVRDDVTDQVGDGDRYFYDYLVSPEFAPEAEVTEGWFDDKGNYTSTGTTTYLLKDPEGTDWSLFHYKDTPGSNPLHLGKMIDQHHERLGWRRGEVIAQWKGDIDEVLAGVEEKLSSGKEYIHSYKMELQKALRDLSKAKEVMNAGKEVRPANTEARDPHAVIGNFLKQKEQRSARGRKLYTDREFQDDLAAVKAGKADASAMADKWGPRGGAFLNFVREGEPTDSDYAIGMAQAKKATGDKKPLKKSTIKKAHKIARAVARDESVEEDSVCWDGYEKVPGKKDYEKGSCRKKTTNEAMPSFGKVVTISKGGQTVKQMKVQDGVKMHHLARELRGAKLGLNDLDITNAARELARGKSYSAGDVEITIDEHKPRQFGEGRTTAGAAAKRSKAARQHEGYVQKFNVHTNADYMYDLVDVFKKVLGKDFITAYYKHVAGDSEYARIDSHVPINDKHIAMAQKMMAELKHHQPIEAYTGTKESVQEKNKGLYHNVNKRKRAGTSRPKGHPKAPTDQAWKDAAKTAKKESAVAEAGGKIACVKCDAVSTAASWKKNNGFCPKCKTSSQGVAEQVNEKEGGMSDKERKAYNRKHGSNLKRAQPSGGKRRTSYCARSKGQMDQHNIDCRKDPDKPICKARRDWNC